MKSYNDDSDQMLDPDVLAALQENLTPIAPRSALRGQILARALGGAMPDGAVTVRAGEEDWHTLIEGIDFKMLTYDERGGTKSFLLRARAGMRMPAHRHHCYEECLVLEGEFSFGDLTLRAGDFHGAGTDHEHCEAFTETGVTVYLRASIQDYPGINP